LWGNPLETHDISTPI
jgi:hypothetical protein